MESMNQSGSTNEIQELHAEVRGQVQGVGFRYFVVRKAQSLGLRGYTRNASNGGVEVLAQGPRPGLERLLTLLWQGPSAADVGEVRTVWRQPTEHLSGFHVRF
jgi:acylphosphatase